LDKLLDENGKLRTYLKLKRNFGFENYLHILSDFNQRKSFTKFRISNHKLKIETGRYSKPITPLGTDHLTWRGGYGFLFRSEFFFRTTQELEYLFFCRAKREIFFQNSTLGYMTKTLIQIIFFFLHQNQNVYFSNIGNQNIFLEKYEIPAIRNRVFLTGNHTCILKYL
jgi:hypothetical protein